MFAFHRRDENEKEIVAALTAIGAVVSKVQGLPGDSGFPDLCVGYRSRTILLEIKKPNAHQQSARSGKTKRAPGNSGPVENSDGRLTQTQVTWWSAWIGGEAYVCETADQVVRIVKGADLPIDLTVAADDDGVLVAWTGVDSVRRVLPRMSADQARALAGALHEQAGIAQAISKKVGHE